MAQLDEEISLRPFSASCACKGIRSCKTCEAKGKSPSVFEEDDVIIYHYCWQCMKAWDGGGVHPDHKGHFLDFAGIYIQEEFISPEQETNIANEIYQTPFTESQSGRRKQDYGPKVNFKRKKVKSQCFTGLPKLSENLYQQILGVDILSDFVPVEQCHLEYTPERGSAIDPHFDDFWLWGERLVTLNLLSDTILYFTCEEFPGIEVSVAMRRRSLIVVYGEARSKWKHGIHRTDIQNTRLAVTLRELSSEFCDGGERSAEGKALIETALTFNGTAVGLTSHQSGNKNQA